MSKTSLKTWLKRLNAGTEETWTENLWTWRTANDQHVCDACSPLNGQLVQAQSPPPHPRCTGPKGCRCWTIWSPTYLEDGRVVLLSGKVREVVTVE